MPPLSNRDQDSPLGEDEVVVKLEPKPNMDERVHDPGKQTLDHLVLVPLVGLVGENIRLDRLLAPEAGNLGVEKGKVFGVHALLPKPCWVAVVVCRDGGHAVAVVFTRRVLVRVEGREEAALVLPVVLQERWGRAEGVPRQGRVGEVVVGDWALVID